MTTEEIIKKLEPWLTKHRRPAWKPMVEAGDGPVTGSTFCGTPWTGPDAPGPIAGTGRQPLQPFLQLDLERPARRTHRPFGTGLPATLLLHPEILPGWRSGCRSRTPHEPRSGRLPRPDRRPRLPRRRDTFPPKQIVGWTRFTDLPSLGGTRGPRPGTHLRPRDPRLAAGVPGVGPGVRERSGQVVGIARRRLPPPPPGIKLGGWRGLGSRTRHTRPVPGAGGGWPWYSSWTRRTTCRLCSGTPDAEHVTQCPRNTRRSSRSGGWVPGRPHRVVVQFALAVPQFQGQEKDQTCTTTRDVTSRGCRPTYCACVQRRS